MVGDVLGAWWVQLPVVDVRGAGDACGERIPVMTVNDLVQPANLLNDLGMRDLSRRRDPASREFGERAR